MAWPRRRNYWTMKPTVFFAQLIAILKHYSRPPRSLFNLGGAAGKSEFIPANQPQSVPDRRRSDHPSRCVALEALRERMWEVLELEYLKRLAGLVEMFGAARAKELGTTI
jgi:hypothetical protein